MAKIIGADGQRGITFLERIFASLGKSVPPQPTQLLVDQMETQEYGMQRFSWKGC